MKKVSLLLCLVTVFYLKSFAQPFLSNGSFAENGEFGWNTEMSGDYAFVAAPLYQNTFISREQGFLFYGAVHIYKKDFSGQWAQTQRLVADDDQQQSNYFGNSMMINGNYLIIGATPVATVSPSGGNQRDRGDVYLYKLNSSTGLWEKDAKFSRNLNNSLDEYGYGFNLAVTADGNTVFIGGDELKVFVRDGSNQWTQQASFPINGTVKFNESGTMFVATPGNISTYQYDPTNNSFLVQQQVFVPGSYTPSFIVEGQTLVVSNPNGGETYGSGIFGPSGTRGEATIYELISGTWQATQTITSSGEKTENFEVESICGNYLVAKSAKTAPQGEGDGGSLESTVAYVFEKNSNGQWEQVQYIDPNFNMNSGGAFGSVKCENGHLLIGNAVVNHSVQTVSNGAVNFYKLEEEEDTTSCFLIDIPDQAFEEELIDLGIDSDGEINGLICREDAEKVESLRFKSFDKTNNPPPLIYDLTGIEAFINLKKLEIGNVVKATDWKLASLKNLEEFKIFSIGTLPVDELDFSNNKKLKKLNLNQSGSSISKVNLQNGSNAILEEIDLTNNDNICLLVDDVSAIENLIAQGNFEIDPTGSYGLTCPSGKSIGQKTTFQTEEFSFQEGVRIIEIAEDQGSTEAIGYLTEGDFVLYEVDVLEQGDYELDFRVANVFSGGKITIYSNENQIGSVDVPVTGGWESWENVKTTIPLNKGSQDLKLVFSDAPYIGNVNSIAFTKVEMNTSLKIQAENFISQEGISVSSTNGAGDGDAIGYISPGDHVSYLIDVNAEGTYTLNLRAATAIPHGIITFSSGGDYLGEIKMPNTGGWSNYETLSTEVDLLAGEQEITLDFSNAAYIGNIDWFEFVPSGSNASKKGIIESEEIISIFPNPSDNGIISIDTDQEITSVEIHNLNSFKILDFTGDKRTFDVSKLSSGVYFVKVNTTSGYHIEKLSVK